MSETAGPGVPKFRLEIFTGELEAHEANVLLDVTTASHWLLVRWGSLSPHASELIAAVAAQFVESDLFYGDSYGPGVLRPYAPRPVYSPLRLRQQDYLGPVVVIRVDALRRLGGLRTDADGAQVLDVALRLDPESVVRIPSVLGIGSDVPHTDDSEIAEIGVAIVRTRLEELGVDAAVADAGDGRRRVTYSVDGEPLVSIIIPTRGSAGLVAGEDRIFVVEAVRGIVERSTYGNLEFVIVADDAMPQSVADELASIGGDRLTLVRWSERFNFSAKMNRGAAVARGEYLLLLNDDVELVTADWIEQMLGLLQQPGVGLVGALLYFEDGSLQHAGHLYEGGAAGHVGFGATPGRPMVLDTLSVDREVSGVTAACALISAEVFRSAGGFSAQFPGNYNDVDLCFKVRSLGFSIVCSANAHLYHFESRSRDARIAPSELQAIHARWLGSMQVDSYWRDPRSRGF